MSTNQAVQGTTISVKFFYQWAQPNTSSGTLGVHLDDDLNPLNTNQRLLKEVTVKLEWSTNLGLGNWSEAVGKG